MHWTFDTWTAFHGHYIHKSKLFKMVQFLARSVLRFEGRWFKGQGHINIFSAEAHWSMVRRELLSII